MKAALQFGVWVAVLFLLSSVHAGVSLAGVSPAGVSLADASTRAGNSSPPGSPADVDISVTERATESARAYTTDACTGSDVMDLDIEGYGQNTVGGWQPDHDVYCVTSLEDDGPGTLREGCRNDNRPTVVRFALDGVIPLETSISLPSNISIDGRGRDITLLGKGFVIHGQENVILTNLAIDRDKMRDRRHHDRTGRLGPAGDERAPSLWGTMPAGPHAGTTL